MSPVPPSAAVRVRRVIGAVLLALQALIAGSWAAEPVRQVGLGAHVEDYGVRHVDLHSEANCLACAARAMHAAPASTLEVAGTSPVSSRTQAAPPETGRPQAVPGTQRSRAPPALA